MQEELVGYLLGALEADEQARIEQLIESDPTLQQMVADLKARLALLEDSRAHQYEPPPGLAARTWQTISDHQIENAPTPKSMRPADDAPIGRRRWTPFDVVVALGMCIAAACLFFPAIASSKYNAELTHCQNNLKNIGQAMSSFSSTFDGYFPQIPAVGNWSAAGFVAPKLKETGFIQDDNCFLCPGSELANQSQTFIVPLPAEIQKATGVKLVTIRARMGGSYGYNMGYVKEGRLHPIRDQGRSRYALISDAPMLHPTKGFTANHGGTTFNTLFEDGHVEKMTKPTVGEDHIFRSERGVIEPGMHANDAVVAHSSFRPRLVIIKLPNKQRGEQLETQELLPATDLDSPAENDAQETSP